ncbi:MAG: GNAT family N-acetyltransferase [Candidatus Microsaccharimonas sp.]
MTYTIRSYEPNDYEQLIELYKRSELYGGVFDEERDSFDRLNKRVEADSDSIIVAVNSGGKIIGTVSLIEDGRVAWLYRFCVLPMHDDIENWKNVTSDLNNHAIESLKKKGHKEVLVYTSQDETLHKRYLDLGFTKGNDYTCFWKHIK